MLFADADSSSGKTPDSESGNPGSIPGSAANVAPSSSGPGHGPLKAETGVQIPLGLPSSSNSKRLVHVLAAFCYLQVLQLAHNCSHLVHRTDFDDSLLHLRSTIWFVVFCCATGVHFRRTTTNSWRMSPWHPITRENSP